MDNKKLWWLLILSWITNWILIGFLFFTIHRFLPPVETAPKPEMIVPLPQDKGPV